MALFDRLRSLLGTLAGDGGGTPQRPSADDPRVAAAALLFHVMDADGVREEAEHARLRAVLAQAYGLDDGALDALLQAGEAAEAEGVDLYRFTSVLMRRWSAEERTAFVGLLWEIVFADGELHELEDHTLWRVADLLAVDTRDRVTLRRAAADRVDKGS